MAKDIDPKASLDAEELALEIMLTAKAARTAVTLEEYIQLRSTMGVAAKKIEQELIDDLLDSGPIFNEFRNAVKATVGGSVDRIRDKAQVAILGTEINYRWVAVLMNTCEDCLPRHNKVMSYEEWEADGLPRTGHTICGQNCKCVLLPETATETEVIKRGRKREIS